MTARPIIGLDDAFGARARELRELQRRLLDLFAEADYEEVIPPIVERPDALKSGAGRFLADQTVVFTDPAGAGLLALRSDMTPQIARIAATRLLSEKVLKLSYSGTIMMARPELRGGSRQQWQTGIECLGIAGAHGDAEVMHLAARSMLAAGFTNPVLQVGHIGLLKALVAGSSMPLDKWTALVNRRSPDDLKHAMREETLSEPVRKALLELTGGMADRNWIEANRQAFGADFERAADELLVLVAEVGERMEGDVHVYADAGVMPRFLYHSGILFAGYAEGVAHALLHGGRYDAMMAAHGRDMPATGFSCDLWAWLDAV
ncbi:ATP phosphoribosyltransferase regulatory subunit [Mariprofundus ferrooxydans]|uniref:ATP phosphoribosyltransferase regulatory subunit n=1 Tax=Mariprofundus ferrooxydans PV-1 TaxID=314345 RepID=Q0F2Y5_9PROT|nr:ATP phosphoribosyltransferase regulatory subunit [Mariprofundus ferrooxydans]EAU56156.1 ATP phosphoribosyltransferase regulatory subunit [Mariprofundus ferrooxydans PV-1]KON48075.1 ATP phosphoribosyltransferase regulatory subunit [Mariprofundus ferrooxydans]